MLSRDSQRDHLVYLWAIQLKSMHDTRYAQRDIVELEETAGRCYDAYMQALNGDYRLLEDFVRDIGRLRDRMGFSTAEVLKAFWAFHDVAAASGWSPEELLRLDQVIRRATVLFADSYEVLREQRGYVESLKSLAIAIDAKDRYTRSHSQEVQAIAEIIARQMGTDIEYGGLFHDIGKIHVPEEVLQKPGPLTPAEWETVREHPIHSYRILSYLPGKTAEIALRHHERPDCQGYPLHECGVPLAAGIVAAADTLHAIVSDRPYSKARSLDEAMREIERVKGIQLRPDVVEALRRVRPAIEQALAQPVHVEFPPPEETIARLRGRSRHQRRKSA